MRNQQSTFIPVGYEWFLSVQKIMRKLPCQFEPICVLRDNVVQKASVSEQGVCVTKDDTPGAGVLIPGVGTAGIIHGCGD